MSRGGGDHGGVAASQVRRAPFLAAVEKCRRAYGSRAPDARDEDHRRLQAKIGELLMETELLYGRSV